NIPPILEPWRGWVLDAHPDANCPTSYRDAGSRSCVWLGALTLELGRTGGKFAADVDVYADSNLALPGGVDAWPSDVRANGAPLPITLLDDRPNARLAAGRYSITGTLRWTQMPDALSLPKQHGLLRLSVDGTSIAQPAFDGERLLLGKAAGAPGEVQNDSLTVR